MSVEWLQREVAAGCPVCGAEGAKAAVLTTSHVIPGAPQVTFLRCAACGAVFLDDLAVPDYGQDRPQMLDYYVEQGAGIDLVVAPLLRVPREAVRRCLEIGCNFPFALDFIRFAFGAEVLGVDPSPLAMRGGEALELPVVQAYFDADLDLGPEPFDLVLCSEILEHVAEPHTLLRSIRERLSPDGLLVLSTPNADILREDTEEGMLVRAMSPGFHAILYNRTALVHVLAQAGFTNVMIDDSAPETLRAFAAYAPAPLERLLPPDRIATHSLLRTYLGSRAREVQRASVAACGFAYRHFKECVNAGLYDEAIASREFLASVYRERAATAKHLPFNLSCALFFSGILELNGLHRPGKAAENFAAAIDSAERLRRRELPFALYDGETEGLLRQSLKHLPMALAATDPQRALRELARLESMDRAQFPARLLDESRAQTFVRLVNAGAYAAAERLAPRIAEQIEQQPSLDPLFCLAMLALQTGRGEEGAELFGRLRLAAERAGAEEMAGRARYHEMLSMELRQ